MNTLTALLLLSISFIFVPAIPFSQTIEQGIKGYLYLDSNSVIFVHWTKNGKKLNGQMYISTLSYDRGKRQWLNDSRAVSLDGVVDGQNITLKITSEAFLFFSVHKTLTGSLGNRGLTILFPLIDGTLKEYRFRWASVIEYNKSVKKQVDTAKTENQILYENRRLVQAEQEGKARIKAYLNWVKSTESAIEDKINNLIARSGELANEKRSSSSLSACAETWEKMGALENKIYRDASTAYTRHKINGVKYSLSSLSYQLKSMRYHRNNSLQYYIKRLESDITGTEADLTKLISDWGSLSQSVEMNNQISPKLKLTQSDINNAVKQIRSQITDAKSVRDKSVKQGDEYLSNANKLFEKTKVFVDGL